MEGKKKKAIRNPNDVPPDMLGSFILSLLTICAVIKPLGDNDVVFWWWFPFIIFNFIYIAKGIKEGWAKPDPANGLVIATGPIAFYAWTYAMVWRKYLRRYFRRNK